MNAQVNTMQEQAQTLSDSIDSDIAKLQAIGADPNNPVPATT